MRADRIVPLLVAALAAASLFPARAAHAQETPQGSILPATEQGIVGPLEAARDLLDQVEDQLEATDARVLDEAQAADLSEELAMAKAKLEEAKAALDAAAEASALQIQMPGVVTPPGTTAADFVRSAREGLDDALEEVTELIEVLGDPERRARRPGRVRRLRNTVDRLGRSLREVRNNLFGIRKRPAGDPEGGVQTESASGGRGGHTLRDDFEEARDRAMARGFEQREAALRRKARATTRVLQKRGAKDFYLAAIARTAAPGAFAFRTYLLELSGDVEARVEIGRFSAKRKVVEASGDGEFAALELATAGSAPGAAFVSCSGRYVEEGAIAGFQGFLLTPSGSVGNLFLPGVTRAELQVRVVGGQITASLRAADTDDPFQEIATVAAPAGPLTISLGFAGMGPGDELGADDLEISALFAEPQED